MEPLQWNSMPRLTLKRGCAIDTATMTDEEILQAIEDFEDTPPVVEPDTTERMICT